MKNKQSCSIPKAMKSNILIIAIFAINYFQISILFGQTVDPLFPNSIVSTDIDFIWETDEDHFLNLEFIGRQDKEMPGNGNNLFDENTFVFKATFSNDKTLGIWCHSSFETLETAQEYAEKVCPRLGKLPFVQRDMLDHVVINTGNHTAFAETSGHFFVLYSENMDDRISTNDLEETVFHESVHASLQDLYEQDTAWTNAQEADGNYITYYAQGLPHLEDMPETAIFAYTMIMHPGRLSSEIETWVINYIPHKLHFFESIYGECTVGMQEVAVNLKASVYPNPSSDKTTLEFQKPLKARKLFIFSASGSLIKTLPIEGKQNTINIEDLPSGIYLFSIPNYTTLEFLKR